MFKPLIQKIFGVLLLCSSLLSVAQNTITLTTGNDAYIRVQQNSQTWANLNYVNSNLLTYSWTHNSVPTISRNLINFNGLCQIPAGSTITDARLNFRCAINDPYFFAHNMEGTQNNSMFIRRVTGAWTDNVVTWNTQPASTSTNQVALASTVGNSTQNFLNINVTTLVQDMFANNSFNGFQLALQDETFFNSTTSPVRRDMNFASFDNTNAGLRPTLTVTYTCPGGVCCPANNSLVATLVSPTANPSQFYTGGNAVYSLSFTNNSCVPITNFNVAPSSLPSGLTNVAKFINGVSTPGTFTIPGNSTVTVEIRGVYTLTSAPSTFVQSFSYGAAGCANTSGTLTNSNVKTVIGCPSSLSGTTVDCGTTTLPTLIQSSLSLHNTHLDMKEMDFKFSYDNNILSLASPALNLNAAFSAGTVTSSTPVISGSRTTLNYHIVFPAPVDFVTSSSLSNGGAYVVKGQSIITLRFNMNTFPSCLTKVDVLDFHFTNASGVAQAPIASDYASIGVNGASCACTNTLDATFTIATAPFKVGVPLTLTANSTPGTHLWRIGGPNGQLLGSTASSASYSPTESGSIVIEHTILSGNAAKVSTQTITVYNVLTASVLDDAFYRYQPAPDASVVPPYAAQNYGNITNLLAYSWTHNGVSTICRSAIKFNMCPLPAGATISSANLYLYCDINDPYLPKHNWEGAFNNSFFVQRATSSWNQGTVNWSNQPTSTTTNQVSVAQTGYQSTQDFTLNVTSMVQDMVNLGNNGFVIRLQDETPYSVNSQRRNVTIASSNNAAVTRKPKLEILYLCPGNNCTNSCRVTANGNGVSDQLSDEFDFGSDNSANIEVSPNPTETTSLLFYNVSEDGEVKTELYDLQGNRIALLSEGFKTKGNHEQIIDKNELQLKGGIYMVVVSTNGKRSSARFIVN